MPLPTHTLSINCGKVQRINLGYAWNVSPNGDIHKITKYNTKSTSKPSSSVVSLFITSRFAFLNWSRSSSRLTFAVLSSLSVSSASRTGLQCVHRAGRRTKIVFCKKNCQAKMHNEPDCGRFSKKGLGEEAYTANQNGHLRLLVHYPGSPPFLCVIAGTKTVGELQKEVVRQHKEMFAGGGDVPTVKVRWLEDSQRHALAASSCCGAVLADR